MRFFTNFFQHLFADLNPCCILEVLEKFYLKEKNSDRTYGTQNGYKNFDIYMFPYNCNTFCSSESEAKTKVWDFGLNRSDEIAEASHHRGATIGAGNNPK